MWAIIDNGAGEPVSYRKIRSEWELAEGEVLKTDEYPEGKTLTTDKKALRELTAKEKKDKEDKEKKADSLPTLREAAITALLRGEALKPDAPQAIVDYVAALDA